MSAAESAALQPTGGYFNKVSTSVHVRFLEQRKEKRLGALQVLHISSCSLFLIYLYQILGIQLKESGVKGSFHPSVLVFKNKL